MWLHVGEDSVYEMIIQLSALADECAEPMQVKPEMVMPEEDQLDSTNFPCCHICKQEFYENEQLPEIMIARQEISSMRS